MRPLTSSGAGVRIAPGHLTPADVPGTLRRLLAERRFVVIQRACASQREAVEFMGRFGPVNQASTRKDGAVVVEDAKQAEVFRSSAALPLHKDGVLTGFDVVLVGIYCIAFQDVVGGRTYVSDAMRALGEVPPQYVRALREHGLEAMAVDATGYYRAEYEGVWHPFPAFKARPGSDRETLNIGLRAAPGEPASWLVRVAHVAPALSDEILSTLRAVLLKDEYTYYHDWQEGDLLLMDNYEVLHGREAFQARERRLANIQVLADPA